MHVLLDAGIDVLTTMNVQHVESLNDQIWQSTGVRVRETIPDWVLKETDEIVMVDLTPQALLNRLARGVVYAPERAQAALDNFFKEADARRAARTGDAAGRPDRGGPATSGGVAGRGAASGIDGRAERLLLLITPDPSSGALIRRGRRVADYLRAPCLAVFVSRTGDLAALSPPADVRASSVSSISRAACRLKPAFSRAKTRPRRWSPSRACTASRRSSSRAREKPSRWSWSGYGLIQRIVGLARDMQVTIVADRSRRQRGAVSHRRP